MIERQNDSSKRVVLALTTFSDLEKARQFGTQVVDAQLVACANLQAGLESIYRWKGKVEIEQECLVIMKTVASQTEALEKFVQENHPYEEPEFLVLPVEEASATYLDWVRQNVLE